MKKTFLLLIALCLAIILQAQVSKTVNVTAGGLSVQENAEEFYIILGREYFESGFAYGVSIESNTSWNVSVVEDWVLVDPLSGIGDSTLGFYFYNNSTSITRTAIANVSGVGVASQTITLTQEPTPDLLTVSRDMISIGSDETNGEEVTISTLLPGLDWMASSDQAWLTVSQDSGTGDGTLTFIVSANETSNTRTAIVTVHTELFLLLTDKTITIIQDAGTGSAIHDYLTLEDSIVSDHEIACFNAYYTITIAGTDTVEFQSGSTVDLIAGGSILFLPGFHAFDGSEMNASITTDSTFCDGAPGNPIVNKPVAKSNEEDSFPEKQVVVPGEKSIKVYPNPNNGQFKIELMNFENGASITIYNILGAKVYQSMSRIQDKCEINLLGLEKGIYVVKVIGEKEQFTKKITVN